VTGLSIVGAGSLGQAFAALLAQSGQPVTLLATPATASRLHEAGRVCLRGLVSADIPAAPAPAPAGTVGVTADPSRLPAGVGLLFMTKGHQLQAAAAAVRAVWPPVDDGKAWVGGVQNGLAKDDLLAQVFGTERVVGAVTILGAARQADGQIAVSGFGCTYLGEFDGRRSGRVGAAIEGLRKAGIPAEELADIRSVLWSKACNAAGVFGVSVLARASASRFFRNPDLIRAYLALVRETAALAGAYGVPVGDYMNFPIRSYVTRPDEETVARLSQKETLAATGTKGVEVFPSMTQDLLAGRALEVDGVFADLVERAERAAVAVPRLRFVRDMLRGIDPGRPPTSA